MLNLADQHAAGLGLVCDREGTVLHILRDDLGVATERSLGQSFTLLVDRGSFAKALSFLAELRSQGAAFDWQLNVPAHDQIVTLTVGGAVLDATLLIFAAPSQADALTLYEEMMRIGNEQMNTLRHLLKERSQMAALQVKFDAEPRPAPDVAPTLETPDYYAELMRLNNELMTLQRELAKKSSELARTNEQKNHFIGMAAHDLRNPLYAIQMYSEFLIAEAAPGLAAEHREFLDIIYRSSQFMLQLVEDFLDLSAIEAGKLHLHRQTVELWPIIVENIALSRPFAQRKQLELRLTPPAAGLPRLSLDVGKMRQVLTNLLTNAIKFTPPQRVIDVQVSATATHVNIAVTDQGQGIPAADLERIFAPFERSTLKTPTGEKSSGLGLAIVRKIVQAHGGRVWAESQVGQGATFYVALPVGG